eukprot:TRINITY_DN810_c0_g1_i1.p1 TRINITY_DN810_c0_g1~~TRINITY_DN810_c0_g1_i1.p1  ORF type:complete len:572 (+),score=91.04 TRINITY_DN810_c0_g1_i1:132-1847(+)
MRFSFTVLVGIVTVLSALLVVSEGTSYRFRWDRYTNPLFNGEVTFDNLNETSDAKVYEDGNSGIQVIGLDFTIKEGDSIFWITVSSANLSGYGIQAMDRSFTDTVSKYEDNILPPTVVGGELSTAGEEQSIKYTFYDKGTFCWRDPTYNDPNDHPMLGCVTVEDNNSGDGDDGVYIYGQILSWTVLVLLCLSILGALCTLFTFTLFPKIRTYPIKLIMYLCVCIVIGFLFFILAFEDPFLDDQGLCFVTGITVHMFFLANFCWTFCIALNFYLMIVRRNREPKALEKYYHLFSWGVPTVCATFIICFQKYGNRDGVCYITDSLFIFLFFFFPGLVIISANAILFFFVAKEIHETLASAPKTNKRERRKELKVYISIFISIGLSWIFGFLMVLFSFQQVLRLIWLTLFSVTTPLQGFFIFLCYCFNLRVLGCYCGLIGKVIPFFRRWENLDTRTATGRTASSRSSLSRSQSRGGSTISSTRSVDTTDTDLTSSAMSRGDDDDREMDVFAAGGSAAGGLGGLGVEADVGIDIDADVDVGVGGNKLNMGVSLGVGGRVGGQSDSSDDEGGGIAF